MNLSSFISKKIRTNKSNRFSKPIVNISIISIALGVSVLILVFAITGGFRKEIENKVIGFGSHIE
jgi:lipoprotein-releasing system permease protein